MSRSVIRAIAPLRIGLAGGGTDLDEYSRAFGGAVVSGTIAKFAHVALRVTGTDKIELDAQDLGTAAVISTSSCRVEPGLELLQGAYDRISKDYLGGQRPGVQVSTFVDCPVGSGLGSSSALAVALVTAFAAAFDLIIAPLEIAELARTIERDDLGMAGGKQDFYSSAIGGFNFMTFTTSGQVVVERLALPSATMLDLQASMMIGFTGQSRASHNVISQQRLNLRQHMVPVENSLHLIRQSAYRVRDALAEGSVETVGDVLNATWQAKKATAESISTTRIDRLIDVAMEAGATSCKISGAGGGGYMVIFSKPELRSSISTRLQQEGVSCEGLAWFSEGVQAWSSRV